MLYQLKNIEAIKDTFYVPQEHMTMRLTQMSDISFIPTSYTQLPGRRKTSWR